MVKTLVTAPGHRLICVFMFFPVIDVICDQLLNKLTATWNLFVKLFEQVCIFVITLAVYFVFFINFCFVLCFISKIACISHSKSRVNCSMPRYFV